MAERLSEDGHPIVDPAVAEMQERIRKAQLTYPLDETGLMTSRNRNHFTTLCDVPGVEYVQLTWTPPADLPGEPDLKVFRYGGSALMEHYLVTYRDRPLSEFTFNVCIVKPQPPAKAIVNIQLIEK